MVINVVIALCVTFLTMEITNSCFLNQLTHCVMESRDATFQNYCAH